MKASESILASIMTADEYSETRHDTPYIFELKAQEKTLHYFGTRHTRDPQDPLFVQIETAFNEAKPDIVFIEGIHVQSDMHAFNECVKMASREEIIDRMGESGFTLKLALEKGIIWHSPEPSDKDLFNYLLEQGFSKDQIFSWEVLHILPQYGRQMHKGGFKTYVAHFIERFKETTCWNDFDYSYEHAIQLGEKIIGRPIDVENEPRATDLIDPIPWTGKKESQTILNRIGEASSHFRDRKIVTDILDAYTNHDRLFIVYGATHAAMQEPALKMAFKL